MIDKYFKKGDIYNIYYNHGLWRDCKILGVCDEFVYTTKAIIRKEKIVYMEKYKKEEINDRIKEIWETFTEWYYKECLPEKRKQMKEEKKKDKSLIGRLFIHKKSNEGAISLT